MRRKSTSSTHTILVCWRRTDYDWFRYDAIGYIAQSHALACDTSNFFQSKDETWDSIEHGSRLVAANGVIGKRSGYVACSHYHHDLLGGYAVTFNAVDHIDSAAGWEKFRFTLCTIQIVSFLCMIEGEKDGGCGLVHTIDFRIPSAFVFTL